MRSTGGSTIVRGAPSLVMLIVMVAFGPTASADAGDVMVVVEPGPTFADDLEVEVVVSGLDDFEGMQLGVSLCGNVSADGSPAAINGDACFALDDPAGSVITTVTGSTMRVPYRLALQDIGAAGARCVPSSGELSCQVIVAIGQPGELVLVGASVSDLVAAVTPATLPVTGVNTTTVVVLVAAAGLLYLGWFLESATAPARRRVAVVHRGS